MRTIPAALLLAVAALCAATPAMAEEGFRDLFNGKDLDGWKNVNCAPETWSVQDGMIHCTGKPTGELRTTRQYENFILELEWRHLKPAGNAGVFVWAGPISAKGQPFLRAIEVQVLENDYGNTASYTTHGDVFPIHGSEMKPHGRHNGMRSFPSENRSKPSPEWNHYRIECNDGVVRLSVNGKEVSGGSEANWRKGYIALESEGSPVDFRNIRVKELPSTGATPEMSAPEWRGFESLYNGADLRGWQTADKGWKSNDWRLVHGGDSDGISAPLWCEQKFGDGELIFDWKLPKDGKGTAKLLIEGSDQPIFEASARTGVWHRTHVSIDGTKVSVSVDGGDAATSPLPEGVPAAGRTIGLLTSGGAAEFAGIYMLKKESQ